MSDEWDEHGDFAEDMDDYDDCDCVDFDEDILTGRCECPACGRIWYRGA